MKRLLKRVILLFIPFIVLYLITAFAFNDLDFYNWSERIKLLTCFIGGALGFTLASTPKEYLN